MDILNEYNELIMDDFIPVSIYGVRAYMKANEDGNLIIYSPERSFGSKGIAVAIAVEEIGTVLEVDGTVKYLGNNMYEIEVRHILEVVPNE